MCKSPTIGVTSSLSYLLEFTTGMWYTTPLNAWILFCTIKIHIILPVPVAIVTVGYPTTLKLKLTENKPF